MNLNRATFFKYGRYALGVLLVATAYIVIQAVTDVRSDMAREAHTDITYRDTVDGVDWYTYTNEIYGYAISFPKYVLLERSSEMSPLVPQTKAAQQDSLIFLSEKDDDRIFTISAGAAPDFEAQTHDDLNSFFETNLLPRVREESDIDITADNLQIVRMSYQGLPAIEIKSPIGYRIITSNSDGMIMTVSGNRYTGATTTPKERLTREIMETFRVLE